MKNITQEELDLQSFIPHFSRVHTFMQYAEQPTPDKFVGLTYNQRKLRLSLILEEFLELVDALGMGGLRVNTLSGPVVYDTTDLKMGYIGFALEDEMGDINPVAALDAHMDIMVTNTGGVIDLGVQEPNFYEAIYRVDKNNLEKFADGAYKDENGKLRKPPNFKPVTLDDLIKT